VDPDRVQEALLQIALNAIEAMPHGGKLRIHVFQEKVSKKTFFQFVDSGAGISEEDLKNAFSPFFTTKHESAGLGLSIALKIFELHGGSLNLESRQGTGTTVTGMIPAV
jgi:two-component system sensor histidine kinase HydH